MLDLNRGEQEIQPKLSRNGKRLWSKAQKQVIVKEAMRPDMSVSKVSRRYDINANLIFRWIKAAGYDVEATSALVPIGIIGSPNKLTPTKQNQPAPLSCRSYAVPPVTATTMIEVDLRGGTKIRIDAGVKGVSLQQILKLIRGLA